MALLFVYLFLALVVSFLCSILEAVLLSTPISYLRTKTSKASQQMIQLKQEISNPLAAILTMNTIAHTVGAAGVGAQAINVFGEAYFGIVSAILTILILLLTEIIPKTIGARYWRDMVTFSSYMIMLMMFITYPLVVLSSSLSKLISGKKHDSTTSREEISVLAQIGVDEGIFEEKENNIIQNLIRLKAIKAFEVMTPRVVVTKANEDMLLEDFLKNNDYKSYSRIPVYSDDELFITGYVLKNTVFEKLAEKMNDLRLKDIKREIISVSGSEVLFSVWEELLVKKEHIVVVVDEFGGLDGILTMEDIIETLIGHEILDEKDTIIDLQKYAREKWKLRQHKKNILDDSNEKSGMD